MNPILQPLSVHCRLKQMHPRPLKRLGVSAFVSSQDSIRPRSIIRDDTLGNSPLSFGSKAREVSNPKVSNPQITEDRLKEIVAFCNTPLPLQFKKNDTPLTLLQVPKTQHLKKFDTNAFTKPLGTTHYEDIKLIASTLIQMEGLGLVKRVKDYNIDWMIDWTLTPLGEAVATSDESKLNAFVQRAPLQTEWPGVSPFFSSTLGANPNKPSTTESLIPSFPIHPQIRQEILQDKINLLKGLEGTLPQGTTGWEVMQKIKGLTLNHPKFSFWLQGGLKEDSILHSFLSENKGDVLEKLNILETLGLVQESRSGRWKLSGKGVKVLLSKTPMEASQLTAPEIEVYLTGEIQKIEHEKTARKMKLLALKKTILASQKSLEALKTQWETLKKEALHLYDRSKDKTVQTYQESLSEKALETLLKSEVLQVQFEEETKLDEQKQQYMTLSENHYRDWLIQSNQILIQIQRAQSKLKQLATQHEMQLLESSITAKKPSPPIPLKKFWGGCFSPLKVN
ncbi:MAG: hypothetical protein K2X66_09090, partial [Cyanobacteria bacterium]|nr:hypothetical protein [Cyanobacteriota bacterium]